MALGSKWKEPLSDLVAMMVAVLGVMEVSCVLGLLVEAKSVAGTGWTSAVLVSIAALICQLILNAAWQGVYWSNFHKD